MVMMAEFKINQGAPDCDNSHDYRCNHHRQLALGGLGGRRDGRGLRRRLHDGAGTDVSFSFNAIKQLLDARLIRKLFVSVAQHSRGLNEIPSLQKVACHHSLLIQPLLPVPSRLGSALPTGGAKLGGLLPRRFKQLLNLRIIRKLLLKLFKASKSFFILPVGKTILSFPDGFFQLKASLARGAVLADEVEEACGATIL